MAKNAKSGKAGPSGAEELTAFDLLECDPKPESGSDRPADAGEMARAEASIVRALDSLGNVAPIPAPHFRADLKTSLEEDGIAVGQTLDDKYFLSEVIGEGGMGVVFKSRLADPVNRPVAVKVLQVPGWIEDVRQAAGRFRDEIRILAQLKNPHIVELHSAGTVGPMERPYFVMEYIDGVTLKAELEKHGPFSAKRAVRIALQICDALAAAHAAGVIHRDLKLDNVMLLKREERENDSIKVLDFGIAALRRQQSVKSGHTAQQAVVGTPEYMAPELLCGAQASELADIYALGTMLYGMLTGEFPFKAESTAELVAQKLSALLNSTAPSAISGIPDGLNDLIRRMLDPNASLRPASAEAVKRKLTDILEQLESGGVGASAADVGELAPAPETPTVPVPPAESSPASGAAPSAGASAPAIDTDLSGRPRARFRTGVRQGVVPSIAAALAVTVVAVFTAQHFFSRPDPVMPAQSHTEARPKVLPLDSSAKKTEKAAVESGPVKIPPADEKSPPKAAEEAALAQAEPSELEAPEALRQIGSTLCAQEGGLRYCQTLMASRAEAVPKEVRERFGVKP